MTAAIPNTNNPAMRKKDSSDPMLSMISVGWISLLTDCRWDVNLIPCPVRCPPVQGGYFSKLQESRVSDAISLLILFLAALTAWAFDLNMSFESAIQSSTLCLLSLT
jgi:hypothetical protein